MLTVRGALYFGKPQSSDLWQSSVTWAHENIRAAKAHFVLCIFGSPALILRDFLRWILAFKSSCWILFFETLVTFWTYVNFSICNARKQGVPQLDMCCVKIQWSMCFKSCACPFCLILSAHALGESVNRELGDIPSLALITHLLYPLSYLFLRPLVSLSAVSFKVALNLWSSLLPCLQPFPNTFQSLWDQTYTRYSRQTNQPFIQWLSNSLSFILYSFPRS